MELPKNPIHRGTVRQQNHGDILSSFCPETASSSTSQSRQPSMPKKKNMEEWRLSLFTKAWNSAPSRIWTRSVWVHFQKRWPSLTATTQHRQRNSPRICSWRIPDSTRQGCFSTAPFPCHEHAKRIRVADIPPHSEDLHGNQHGHCFQRDLRCPCSKDGTFVFLKGEKQKTKPNLKLNLTLSKL